MLRWIPFILFALAFLIRIVGAGSVPVAGDELGSLTEANSFANFNGFLYFLSLNLWMRAGDSAVWLRLLTIIPAALAVPLTWAWVRNLRGEGIATLTALLLALSPMAVEYAREIRFYGIYLFSSALFLWAYSRIAFIPDRKSKLIDWILLLIAGGLLLTSQLLGTLLVSLVILHAVANNFHRFSRSVRTAIVLIVILGVVSFALMLIFPSLFAAIYLFVRRFSASPSYQSYPGGRGIGFITLGKLAVFYLSFSLGQFVPPFDFLFVVPGLLIVTVAGIAALVRLAKETSKQALRLALLVGGGSIVGLYIVFDSLWPSDSSDSAVPKYIIFALPVFLWILAEGVTYIANRSGRTIGITLVIAVQLIGLSYLYTANWSSTYKDMRLDQPTEFIRALASQTEITVLTDGRSSAVMKYYLRGTGIPVVYVGDRHPTNGTVVFTSYDDRAKIRCPLQPELNRYAANREIYTWVNYPFFVYAWDLSMPRDPGNRTIALPRSVYGIEFADVRIPQLFQWGDFKNTIGGMYSLPTCDGMDSWSSGPIPQGEVTKRLLLVSNLLRADKIPDGTVIAHIKVTTDDGAVSSLNIRKGYETQLWDGVCVADCQSVLTFHKRFALLGASAYPEAYRDFQATIWGSALPLAASGKVQFVEITTLQPDIPFNIWGLYLLPD